MFARSSAGRRVAHLIRKLSNQFHPYIDVRSSVCRELALETLRVMAVALGLVLIIRGAYAQAPAVPSIDRVGINDTGTHPYAAYDGARENINLQNNNLNITIPLVSLPGRAGHDLNLGLIYDSNIWRVQAQWAGELSLPVESTPGIKANWNETIGQWAVEHQFPYVADGWHLNWPTIIGASSVYYAQGNSGTDYSACYGTTTVILQDGSRHSFSNNVGCNSTIPGTEILVMDDEDTDGMQIDHQDFGTDYVVTLRNGTKIYFASVPQSGEESRLDESQGTALPAYKIVDANGNSISQSTVNGIMTFTDTIGRVVTVGPTSVSYTDVNGTPQTISLRIASQSVTAPTGIVAQQTLNNGMTYTESLLQEVTLNASSSAPLSYSFQYNSNGELSQVTYPHGGCTSYDYGALWRLVMNPLQPGPIGADIPGVIAKHVSPTGQCSSSSPTTTYSASTSISETNNDKMVIVYPDSHQEVHYFSEASMNPYEIYHGLTAHEIEVDTISSSGTTLKSVLTSWTGSHTWDLPQTVTTVFEPATTDAVTVKSYQYDTIQALYQPNIFVNQVSLTDPTQPVVQTLSGSTARYLDAPTQITVSAYGTGNPGSVIQTTTNNYQDNTQSNLRILGLLTNSTVTDGTYSFMSAYGYDETTPSSSTSLQRTDPGAVSRGDVTSVRRCVDNGASTSPSSCSRWVITQYSYDQAGNLTQVTDPAGNSTSFSWSDVWSQTTCAPSANSDAYLTQITNAKGFVTTAQYRSCSGSRDYLTDANAQHTQYWFDSYRRPTSVSLPDGGGTSVTYYDSSNQATFSTNLDSSGRQVVNEALYDGIGRLTQTQVQSDHSGTDYVDFGYDGMDRKISTSNPHRSSPATTDGTAGLTYDGLDRVTLTTEQDSSTASVDYSNFPCTTATDEAGLTRTSCVDALGRLVSVTEDPNGLAYQTSYQYDSMGNLLSVAQGTLTGRQFTYDGLSRLTSSENPETGTISYAYSNSSSGVCSGEPSAICSKTDARGITTTYSYNDPLNRVTGKFYSDGTPSACFAYDTATTNGNGRLGAEWTQSGTCSSAPPSQPLTGDSITSYDPMGRSWTEAQSVALNVSGSHTLSYTYDLMGNVISSNDGGTGGMSVSYSADTANRPGSVISNVSGQATTLFEADDQAASYLGAVTYSPVGLANAEIGIPSGTSVPNITLQRNYDNRTRPISETDLGQLVATPSAGSTGTILISGNEGSQTTSSTYATATLSVTGSEGTHIVCQFNHCVPQPDTGTIGIVIDGFSAYASYGGGSTDSSVVTSIVSALNASGSPVTAVANGISLNLTSLVAGTAGDYPIQITNGSDFSANDPGMALTGGVNGGTTYDTGVVSVTINGVQTSASWQQGDNPSSIAAKVSSAINSADSAFLSASVGANGQVLLQATQSGTATNWPVSVSVNDTAGFATTSFNASASGMSGGGNATTRPGIVYSYSITTSGGNTGYAANGSVVSAVDSVTGLWSYSYDSLNRLVSGVASTGSYQGQSTCWAYDRYGNRQSQIIQTGTCPASVPQTTGFDVNNHVLWTTVGNTQVAWSTNGALPGYDSSGNVLGDSWRNYLYDAESRVCAVQNSSGGAVTGYVYDAEGRRVAKGTLSSFSCSAMFTLTNRYLLGLNGEEVAELDGQGNWLHTNVYSAGKLLATFDRNGTHYAFSDWLGTRRAQTTSAGVLDETCASLPYGDYLNCSGPGYDPNGLHFTGKLRDTESNLDYFGARYYASSMGRWMSPDWAVKSEPVPYAKLDDPQTLNLYGYVKNNPLSRFDPDGHDNITYDQHGKEIDRTDKHGFWWHTIHDDNYAMKVGNTTYNLVGQTGPLADLGKGTYSVMSARDTSNLMSQFVGARTDSLGMVNLKETIDHSQTNGSWDFKNTKSNTADFYIVGGNAYHADYIGNMMWGQIMSSYGYTESFSHLGAGLQQIWHDAKAGEVHPGQIIHQGGDQPLDYEAIHRGYNPPARQPE